MELFSMHAPDAQPISFFFLKNRTVAKRFSGLLAFMVAVCLIFTAQAQTAPPIQWQKSLGGSSTDWARDIKQTTDGGFIVAGISGSNDGDVSGNHGGFDYWIVKLDAEGNLAWQKSLGGSNDDQAFSIQQTTDGGFIVAGTSASNDGDVSGNHGNDDYWIVKLDANGNIVWQKALGGSSSDIALSIQQTIDGGFIIAGFSNSNDDEVLGNHGGYDYWIVKLNVNGKITWQKSFGGSGDDEANSIQQTSDGGFIIAGFSGSNDGDVSGNHGGDDYWIVKLDVNGNLIWQKSLGGNSVDEATSIQQTSDGGFIVAGFTNSGFQFSDFDYWILKLDANGNLIWQKYLGGDFVDEPFSIQQTTDGGFIIAGLSYSNDGEVSGNHGGSDYWIVKLDTNGNLIWQNSLGGSFEDYSYSIQQTADSGFIIAGPSASNDGDASENHGTFDYWVVKLAGETQACLSPVNLSVTNVTATSAQLSWSIEGSPDKFLISYHAQNGSTQMRKVAGTSSSINISNLTPATFYLWNVTAKCGSLESSLAPGQRFKTTSNREEEWSDGESLKLYPNPSSGLFTINLQTGEETTTSVTIQIMNALGETIYTLESTIDNGVLQKEIQLKDAATGMYLVKVTTSSRVYTSQINLQK